MSDVIAQLPETAFDSISEHLLCDICLAPTDQWLRACNEHSFCAPCLLSHEDARNRADGVAKCPVCRGDLVKDDLDHFFPDRTKNELTLDQQLECLQKCGHLFKLSKLKEHMQKECPNGVVSCPMAKLGCSVAMKRCDMDAHLREDSHSHLAMGFMLKMTETFLEGFADLKKVVESHNARIDEQAATIVNLNSAIAQQTQSLSNHGAKMDILKTCQNAIHRKIDDVLSDGEYSLKQIALQTKKRASPGTGQSERAKRERVQVARQRLEIEELKAKVSKESNDVQDGTAGDTAVDTEAEPE